MKTTNIDTMNGKVFERMLPPLDYSCPFCDSPLYVEIRSKPRSETIDIQCFNHRCQAHATARDIETAYGILVQVEIEQTNYQGGDYRDTVDYYDR